jgi:serine/threonine protein kinase
MHDKRLIHRDMKSENCFLAEDDEIRLGDMGLAKELIKDTASTVLGTSHFIAPELRTQEHSYTEKIDIWGIGCIAYELCTCRRSDFGYERAINAEKFFSHIDKKHYSKELVDFIKSCMETNPDLRPTAREIAKKYNDYFSIEIDTPITPFIRDEGSHFETTNSKSKPTFYTLNLDIYRIVSCFSYANILDFPIFRRTRSL